MFNIFSRRHCLWTSAIISPDLQRLQSRLSKCWVRLAFLLEFQPASVSKRSLNQRFLITDWSLYSLPRLDQGSMEHQQDIEVFFHCYQYEWNHVWTPSIKCQTLINLSNGYDEPKERNLLLIYQEVIFNPRERNLLLQDYDEDSLVIIN